MSLVALGCGILLADMVPQLGWYAILPGGLLVLGGLLLSGRRPVARLIPLGLALLGLGLAQQQLRPPMRPNDLRQLADGGKYRIEATVVDCRLDEDGRARLDLKARVHGQSPAPRTGRLRLTVDHCERPFLPGEHLAFTSKLKRPHRFGNPGEFNYPRHLASRGIYLIAYLPKAEQIEILPASRNWRRQMADARARASNEIDRLLPRPQAPLLRALLLGDRDRFPAELRARIAGAGLSHLLAISGLHLGLVGGLLFAAAFFLWRRSERLMLLQPPARVLPLLIAPLLALYTLLTGAAVSTLRALLIWALGSLLLASSRRYRPVDLLWFVVLLMLLINPLWLFEPGLQLSVAGATGILLLVPRWHRRIPGTWRKFADLPLATLAANLATFLLVGLHFHQFAPAGLVSNLFAIPVIGFFTLPAGLVGLGARLAGIPGGEILLHFSGWSAERIVDLADAVAGLPLFNPLDWFPDPLQLLAGAAFVLAIQALSTARFRRATTCLLAAITFLALPTAGNNGHIRVTAVAVGQGEAILLETPTGKRYLVDGGGLRYSKFDIGSRLLLPTLGWLGIHSLDGVILSHPHPDHYLGLEAVLRKMPPRQFITGLPRNRLPGQLVEAFDPQTAYIQLEPGWHRLVADPDTDLRVWVPRQQTGPVNDRSLVVYLGSGSQGVLLTGDLERTGVARLMRQLPDMQVTLLKLPHHGSRHSGTEHLLERLRPAQALVSAGRNNVYRFPAEAVIRACRERGIKLWRTDLDGCVRLVATPEGWQRQQGFSFDINL
ncbi:MAG: DNA internalization-related competence protein ComEC/Rec2 [Deltaproteobacteria bacterium]|nr:MAG: DNA internalization-related competence protein ComEC/Rec2 [Deltaproteobacteria bacterium]